MSASIPSRSPLGAIDLPQGISINALISAMEVSLLIFGVQLLAFLILRNKLARLYQPKTYLVPEKERTTPPPKSPWGWLFAIFRFRDAEIIQKCGLDAYFFQRYLQTLLVIFVPVAILLLAILIPLNFIGGRGQNYRGEFPNNKSISIDTLDVKGLDLLAWGNIRPTSTQRYWAHLVLAILVIVWVCGVFFWELKAFIKIRQDYLTSPEHRLRASATTILVGSIPRELLTEEALAREFKFVPEEVRNVWINRKFDALLKKIHTRDAIHKQLEGAETDLIRLAKSAQKKKLEKDEKLVDKDSRIKHKQKPTRVLEEMEGPVWSKFLNEKDRPTRRLPRFSWTPSFWPCLPIVSEKVDAIYWCRKELARLNIEIEKDQKHPEKFPMVNSAFIQFNNQAAAYMACRSLNADVSKMDPKIVEISPKDVIWDNMSIGWWEQWFRTVIVMSIVSGVTILWSIPVALTASFAQIPQLGNKYSGLKWLNKIPSSFLSFTAGTLPALILGLLLSLVPMTLRYMALWQGSQTGTQQQAAVQKYYFAFVFVQVFLVVSISRGALEAVLSTADIITITGTLANQLPKAANYFFSYMILQALSTSAGTLLQLMTLLSWYFSWFFSHIKHNTARETWARNKNLQVVTWDTFYPVHTNFACIALIYSILAPMIVVFAIITFALLWVAHRYNILYVVQFELDTGGLLYPRAINQTVTGVYVMELCLIGLFFLVEDQNGHKACVSQGIIMIVCTCFTVIYQILINRIFGRKFNNPPVTSEGLAAQPARVRYLSLDGGTDETAGPVQDNPGIELHNLKTGPRNNTLRRRRRKLHRDTEAAMNISNTLFGGYNDDIGGLTPEERDKLVKHVFQHYALRARTPTVWIPRDDIGVSEDEIRRTRERYEGLIFISNKGAALDENSRVVYGWNPPDFSEVDLLNM